MIRLNLDTWVATGIKYGKFFATGQLLKVQNYKFWEVLWYDRS